MKKTKNHPQKGKKTNCQTITCIVSELYLGKSRVCRVEGRNGISPTKGIDTDFTMNNGHILRRVEMGLARQRALTL